MKSWWKASATYPPTWLAIALVVVAVWAIFALLQPPTILAIILVILGLIAIIAWPITMSATGTLERLQFEMPKLPEVSEQELADLAGELATIDDPRPAHQLQAIREKRDNLVEMLDRRLNAGELTYARYLSTAQQVYMTALENLREVAVAQGSVSTIDLPYIDQRLGELEGKQGDRAEGEISSLQRRRALLTTQETKVAELLAQNESAMTLIDRTSTALADAPIGRTPHDADAAMEALEDLANRASKYATDT
ncbi:MAG: hypothetical protein ABFS21_03000 [Actinomycetota bacterium]